MRNIFFEFFKTSNKPGGRHFRVQGVTHEQTDGRTDTLTDKGQRT